MKIYYITLEGISSSVFESQVYALKTAYQRKGFSTTLIIGQKLKAKISIKKAVNLLKDKTNKFILLQQQLNYQATANRIAKVINPDDFIALHCRNTEAAYVGLLIKQKLKSLNIQVVYDVRGYTEGEALYFKDERKKIKLEQIHNTLFNSDMYFNFVSKELYNLYNEIFGVPEAKTIICNSAYNDDIFKLQEQSSFRPNEKVKVLFVGGTQIYQKIEDIIFVFSKRKDINLTIVTTKSIKPKTKHNNVNYLSHLQPEEVNALADHYDYGVIYRSSDAFNNVATPTKVTEYWGKGLKVIAINSAGAYTKNIKEDARLGYFLGSALEIKSLNLKPLEFHEKEYVHLFSKNNFSQSINVEKYIGLFKTMEQTFKS